MTLRGRLLHCVGGTFWNMGVDEALLLHMTPEAPLVLRFYRWGWPAVSIGRFQNAAALNRPRCEQLGIEVVRRPTGGRAVYHDGDLTYSLVWPESATGNRSIRESYRAISSAFSRGLANLGIDLQEGSRESPGPASRADCFALAAVSDLVLGGRKVIGSAQVRQRGWVLQQGSIHLSPLSAPADLFLDAGVPSDALLPDSPNDRSFQVAQQGTHPGMGTGLNAHAIQKVLAAELAAELSCHWEDSRLTAAEKDTAARLVDQKYSCHLWNYERKEVTCRSDS